MFICDISMFNKYGKQKLDERLRPLGMEWHELVVMLVIHQVPGIPQVRLIPFLQTDKANVTKLLQSMEEKQLIRRATDDGDKRNKVCHLTGEGKQLVPQLQEILNQWEAACFQGLSPEDIAAFHRISQTITGNLIREESKS